MAQYSDREHYIPIRHADLLALLISDIGNETADVSRFRRLVGLLSAVINHDHFKLLSELKDDYAPFDPDVGTVRPANLPGSDSIDSFVDRFTFLMERANFKRYTLDEVREMSKGVSYWGLNMDVDFSIFEKLEIFARGEGVGSRSIRRWYNLWLKRDISFPNISRLVLLVKLRPSTRLPPEIDTSRVYLKIFKDIPKMDVEMLLPGARLKMPTFNRLQIGSSLIGSGAWILYNVFQELIAIARFSTNIILGPLIALAGYGYKQWYGYWSTRNMFHLQLTQSLYYRTLGSNKTVLFHLLDEAAVQECREAMLGYYYLWRRAGSDGWTVAELDNFVEKDLERLSGLKVDFEISDALAKLERFRLVRREGERYIAYPIDEAIESLQTAWVEFGQDRGNE